MKRTLLTLAAALFLLPASAQQVPEWLKEGILYHIYPSSFKDSDGDGIGDLEGIRSKLPYVKSLGANTIWLSPVFRSEFEDGGYDITDFYRIDPRFGTNSQLVQLVREAHDLGIRVCLDLVAGHTSDKHPWFRQSSEADPELQYSDYYIWSDSKDSFPTKKFVRSDAARDGNYMKNFFDIQPALNYGFANRTRGWQQAPEDPAPMATREAMKDVMRFWLSNGCDGFRVDMAGSLVKNDPDGAATVKLWQDFRAFLDAEYPEAAMISEWGEPDKSLLGGFHMDFLLHFGPSHYNDLFRCDEPYFSRRGKGSADEFVKKYIENYKKTDGKGLICIPSGNHDMDRMRRFLDPHEMKVSFAFLLSMPGAPFIYYGDEIGMRYVEGLTSKEGGFGRTGSRTPMQWSAAANAGFSDGAAESLYLPIDPAEDRPTAEGELADENSLLSEVRRLIKLRGEHKALQSMSCSPVIMRT